MSHLISRRSLLKTSAAAAAAYRGLPALAAAKAPSKKLNVAVIGVSGRGAGNLAGVQDENILALCDADENRLAGAAQKFPAAKKFVDFREMLDKLQTQLDGVVVSTPDHTHAVAGMMAMGLGKPLYCEKPLAHNVAEVRKMTERAAEKNLPTQMGTQIHAGENYRRVVELIQAGAVGPVDEVHVWCGKGWGGGERPTETPPVPQGLHWDLWLGPAPERPYHPTYLPAQWRRWWDFGNGTLGDMACHYMDLPYWALGLKYPDTVEAIGPPVHPETCPAGLTVHYEFPARGEMPPVKLSWYDGEKRPQVLADKGLDSWRAGVLFVGKEGMLAADYTRNVLLPEEKFSRFERPKPSIPPSLGHHAEWLAAIRTGSPTTCHFGYSGPLAEAVLLGTVAYRVGKKLRWDAARLEAIDCPEAARYLSRRYRQGWSL